MYVYTFFLNLPFLGEPHILVSFVCYHFGSFASFGYRVAKVGKFLEKGNQMTHLTIADIRFNFWPNHLTKKVFSKLQLFFDFIKLHYFPF